MPFVKQALDTPTGTTVAPYPPASGNVNVVIDRIECVADANDNLIEAARRVGVDIPYFCYHPRLSIAGQCRMCLVETSDAPGRLVPGCQVRVKEGLKIITDTPAVKENQRACMEFHLVNHPVDCPICDQSGECKLQDYFMQYDHKPSRLHVLKVGKEKREVLGPNVVYDGERCILCTRCVRFMNEVAEEPQLAVMGRGDHSRIGTFPGEPLTSNYSGNTVDICPVGALLSRDFRFATRVWYVQETPSLCAGCSNGCNTVLGTKGDLAYRYLPRHNEAVNQVWLCDEGRLSYHALNTDRLLQPTGRGDVATNVGQAIADAAAALKPLVGNPKLGVLVSARLSLEEQLVAMHFAKNVLGLSRVFCGGTKVGKGDDFLVREDKDPNRNGLLIAADAYGIAVRSFEELTAEIERGEVKALWAAGVDAPSDSRDTFTKLEVFVALAAHGNGLASAATIALPLALHGEQDGSFVNWYGRLQRFRQATVPRGESRSAWAWCSALMKALGMTTKHESAQAVFETHVALSPAIAAVPNWSAIGDEGVVLPGFLPKEWPRRAPRPGSTA